MVIAFELKAMALALQNEVYVTLVLLCSMQKVVHIVMVDPPKLVLRQEVVVAAQTRYLFVSFA